MAKYKFGFIGTGNMGGALARAAARTLDPARILLADHLPEKAAALAKDLGAVQGDNQAVASECEYIFLGVKPQMLAGMVREILPCLDAREDRFVLVSMAAGVSIDQLSAMTGKAYPVLRIMPNTPASLGSGMILCAANAQVTEAEKQTFLELMRGAGRFDWLDERLIDAGSAVSGCGPAYVYMFIEALADGGVAVGLPRAKAQEYAAQTLIGAARMVLESGQHPGALKDAVCSPGGTTIRGVKALEDGGFRASAIAAVLAAYERTLELGK